MWSSCSPASLRSTRAVDLARPDFVFHLAAQSYPRVSFDAPVPVIEVRERAPDPLDMRSGTEAALARVVHVFGSARPHHAYLFANRRGNRMKVLVHDGIGVWLAARRLNQGRFTWSSDAAHTIALTRGQFDALVLGLPRQHVGEAGVISLL